MADDSLMCPWIELENGWVCPRCDTFISNKKRRFPPYRECPVVENEDEMNKWGSPRRSKTSQEILEEAEKELGIKEKTVHYVTALIAWAKAGFPKRDEEEVERLYEICRECEFNKDETCSVCGCRTKQKGIPLTNKLSMGSEYCPKGKW